MSDEANKNGVINDDAIRILHNNYGVLITVLSICLLVVYAEGVYDFWDLSIGLIIFLFSLSFMIRVGRIEIGEKFLLSLITGIGLSITLAAGVSLSICGFNQDCSKAVAPLADQVVFHVAPLVAGASLLIMSFARRKGL